jgi:predicted transcriptional regulator
VPRRRSIHPTDAELALLQVLWNSGPATLGQLHAALNASRRPDQTAAKTTVATLLGVMLDKHLVRRTVGPRGSLYVATVSRSTAASGIVTKLIDYVFEGSAQRMVAHLVEAGDLTDAELEQLWRRRRAGDEPVPPATTDRATPDST